MSGLPAGWGPALEPAARTPLTLVIGPPEAGKTTFVAALASALAGRGLRVGVVDADLGQSEIGPPTTVGLGRVAGPLGRLGDAAPVALHFVGVTSPAANLPGALVAVHRMVARAAVEGFERVVVDTSGLVGGELGRTLKQAKIDLLRPGLVVSLARERECDAILAPYLRAGSPAVVALPALAAPRRRSAEDRRRFRERALAAYLAGARPLRIDLRRAALRWPVLFCGAPLAAAEVAAAEAALGTAVLHGERQDGEAVLLTRAPLPDLDRRRVARGLGWAALTCHAVSELEGAVAGLADHAGDTLGLGVVREVDAAAPALVVLTPVAGAGVVTVTLGRERYPA